MRIYTLESGPNKVCGSVSFDYRGYVLLLSNFPPGDPPNMVILDRHDEWKDVTLTIAGSHELPATPEGIIDAMACIDAAVEV